MHVYTHIYKNIIILMMITVTLTILMILLLIFISCAAPPEVEEADAAPLRGATYIVSLYIHIYI